MGGTLHLDLPQTTECLPGSLEGPLVCVDAYQAEASQLLARYLSARDAGSSELLVEIECDIGAFICHLAREVEAGETPASVLEFYVARFSDMAR